MEARGALESLGVGSVCGPSVKEERSECREEGRMKRAMGECSREKLVAGWLAPAGWVALSPGVRGAGGGGITRHWW